MNAQNIFILSLASVLNSMTGVGLFVRFSNTKKAKYFIFGTLFMISVAIMLHGIFVGEV